MSDWAAAVAEGDTGGGGNGGDNQANFYWYCAEGANGKPLLNFSYLENSKMRQSKKETSDSAGI